MNNKDLPVSLLFLIAASSRKRVEKAAQIAEISSLSP